MACSSGKWKAADHKIDLSPVTDAERCSRISSINRMEKAKQEQEMELLAEKKPMVEVASTAAVKGKKKGKKMSMVSDAEMEMKEVEKIPGSSGVKDSLKQPLEEDVLKEDKEKHMKPIESAADVSAQTQEEKDSKQGLYNLYKRLYTEHKEAWCLEVEDFVELMNQLGVLLKEPEKTAPVADMAKAGSDDYQNNEGAKKRSFRVVNTGKKMEDDKKKKGSAGVEDSPMQELKMAGSKNNSKNIARSLKRVADASAQAQGGIQNKNKKRRQQVSKPSNAEIKMKQDENMAGQSGVQGFPNEQLKTAGLKKENLKKTTKLLKTVADTSAQAQGRSQRQQVFKQCNFEKDTKQGLYTRYKRLYKNHEEAWCLEFEDFVELMNQLGVLLKESEKTTPVTEMAKAGSDDYQNNQGANKRSFRVVNTGKKMEDDKKKKGSAGVEDSPMQELKMAGSKNNSKNIAKSLKTVADASAQAQGGIQNENKKRRLQVFKPSNAEIKMKQDENMGGQSGVQGFPNEQLKTAGSKKENIKKTTKLLKTVADTSAQAQGGSQRQQVFKQCNFKVKEDEMKATVKPLLSVTGAKGEKRKIFRKKPYQVIKNLDVQALKEVSKKEKGKSGDKTLNVPRKK